MPVLFHGTLLENVPAILERGIKQQKRVVLELHSRATV